MLYWSIFISEFYFFTKINILVKANSITIVCDMNKLDKRIVCINMLVQLLVSCTSIIWWIHRYFYTTDSKLCCTITIYIYNTLPSSPTCWNRSAFSRRRNRRNNVLNGNLPCIISLNDDSYLSTVERNKDWLV